MSTRIGCCLIVGNGSCKFHEQVNILFMGFVKMYITTFMKYKSLRIFSDDYLHAIEFFSCDYTLGQGSCNSMFFAQDIGSHTLKRSLMLSMRHDISVFHYCLSKSFQNSKDGVFESSFGFLAY